MTKRYKLVAVLVLAISAIQAQPKGKAAPEQPTLLELYHSARQGDPVALGQLTTWASSGNAEAQFNLGLMYVFGDGVPKDTTKAVAWYGKAADQGYVGAQVSLGEMYAKGDGVPHDAAQAVAWYRKAADQGHPFAQSHLGAMYYKGEGVPKDLVLSYVWRNLAAAQGDEDSKTARDLLEKVMTPQQIAEAQKLSREWKTKK